MTIVKTPQGHIGLPFNVRRRADGFLEPKISNESEFNKARRFMEFNEIIRRAISLSTDPDAGEFVSIFMGTHEQYREQIQKLNRNAGLPGFAQPIPESLSLAA
ncbi:MAG: hypothetical protein WCK11_04795 [Candidatus Falkowbacteria bacterium]